MQSASLTDERPLEQPCNSAAQQQIAPALEELPVVVAKGRTSKTKAILLALLVVVFNAVGNTLLAVGMKSLHETVGINPAGYVRAMLDPMVAGGVVLLILWLLTRMALMSWADLTFAVPLMAVGYVLATVIGYFGLHEAVGVRQWLGTLLIFAGILVVGTTSHQTTSHQIGLQNETESGDPL